MGIDIPPHISEGLEDDRLEIGSVFFAMVQDTQPPKEKYFVVVGKTADSLVLGNVYINSQINPNKFGSPALRELHLPVTVADCPFLKWNSFIDCSDIYTKRLADLASLLAAPVSPFVGSLPQLLLQRVLETLRGAPTISPAKKRQFGLF